MKIWEILCGCFCRSSEVREEKNMPAKDSMNHASYGAGGGNVTNPVQNVVTTENQGYVSFPAGGSFSIPGALRTNSINSLNSLNSVDLGSEGE